MKKKLTLLAFSLLLAVGWTSNASAQLKRNASENDAYAPLPAFVFTPEQDVAKLDAIENVGPSTQMKAPRRAHDDVYANEVNYTKAQYSNIKYTWYEGTTTNATAHPNTPLTEVVDNNPYQMYWLLRSTYMNKAIPGILYNDVYQEATQYYGVDHGWNIGTAISPEIKIEINNQYGVISAITVQDPSGNTIESWEASSSVGYSSLPSSWRYTTSGMSNTSYTYNSRTRYGIYWNNESGGYIRIPANTYPNYTEGLKIIVLAKGLSSTEESELNINNSNWTLEYTTRYNYTSNQLPGRSNIEAPDYNAYTVFLVKLKDFTEVSQSEGWAERTSQSTTSDLINVFDKYYAGVELLTDGLRVGENPGDTTSGTVFAYTGVLNRFYFIGKGKTATRKSTASYTSGFAIYGPFYEMYEEFSPTTTDVGAQTLDFYTDMHGGKYYSVVHDCATVLGYQHYFSMYGKDTTVYKSVSPIVLYIPDLRSQDGYRTYEKGHQPQVGLYTIHLSAETEPSPTYAQDSTYIVYLDWSSSLNSMVNNTVDQTYVVYTVTYDANNKPIYTPVDTVYNETTCEFIVKQQQTSQQIEYVVMGFPTNATNNPWNQPGGIFFTYSNPDDVQIPGWFDFMVLYRERYESDFVIKEEQNYYRNYLYPTNLAPGTGMTMEQLKKEWPNQTASYTLWRDDRGIAKLEVRAIGDKVYYRIRYYENTQVTTGPNAIGNPNDKNSGNAQMPYNYVEIPNENN